MFQCFSEVSAKGKCRQGLLVEFFVKMTVQSVLHYG